MWKASYWLVFAIPLRNLFKLCFDFLLLFDVKMYYYCEIIMYNIFCSIKNQLHISSLASHGQKIVLPRNTCIFPWNKLFLYHAELYTTSLLPKNQGCQTFTFNIIILRAKLSNFIHSIHSGENVRCFRFYIFDLTPNSWL